MDLLVREEERLEPIEITEVEGEPIVEVDDGVDAYSWLTIAESLAKEGEGVEKAGKLPGIYLVKPHAQLLSEGKKKLIGKLKPLPGDYLHTPVYVVDKDYVWAKVRVEEPKLVGLEDFDKREGEHGVSFEERSRWWPMAKDLYLYSFEILESYADNPKSYECKRGR